MEFEWALFIQKRKRNVRQKRKNQEEKLVHCARKILDEKGELNEIFLNEERIRGLGRYSNKCWFIGVHLNWMNLGFRVALYG
jgi:hypothetical protein